MAEAVMRLVIKKLKRLLVEKAGFVEGAEEKVKCLIDDLKRTVRTLKDEKAFRMYPFVMSVAEIAQDADVYIDTFIPHAEISDLNNFMEEIQCIRNRIEAVETDLKNYCESLEEKDELELTMKSSTTVALPDVEEDTVGLEGEVKLLLEEAIFEQSQQIPTLCILGMGGIGKTTLASLLYNHADVVARFEIRAWVHVSNDFSFEKVLLELIQQLGMEGEPAELVSLSLDDLREMVFEHLEGRTYFIVLDNVWSNEYNDLDIVLNAFPREDCKGRLVITSRSRFITRVVRRTWIHEMQFLDDSKSWELFLKKVFTKGRRCPKHLEKIGRQIVRKCNGLPLAILEAGRKLAEREESESVWQEFLESMDLTDTSASLEISFDRLSARLKSCFACLGFFKEGTTIRADKLVHIFIAGGMLPRRNKEYQTDEEIVRMDIVGLVGEYLVQVKDTSWVYQIKNCDVNYNLHGIAITKAKQELMFEVMTKEGMNHGFYHKPRHRAICCSREHFNYSTNQDKHLLSLFFRGGGSFDASPSYWESFQLLKILDFEGFGLKTLPETVGKLITLKYLGLRNNYLQELPYSLGQLVKLEVLDIAQNFMIQVPNIIWKMDSLRHLYMSDIICRDPLKIDQLCNLQTLTYISVDKWTYEVSGMKMMTSLRKLGLGELDGNSDVSELFASLAELEKLEHLILRGSHFRSMPELSGLHALLGLKQLKLDGLLTSLPNNFPPNIEFLSLSNSCLDEDPMPILETLSKLVCLKLRNAFIGEQMVISGHGFEELQILSIEELWHLRSVEVGEGAMQQLKQFEMRSCPYVKTLPKEIGLVNNTKKLKMLTGRLWESTSGNEASFLQSIVEAFLEVIVDTFEYASVFHPYSFRD